MKLIQAWKSTISFFYPNNFTFFVWITLRSIGMTYRILFFYWGWFFAILVGVTLFAGNSDAILFFSSALHYMFIYIYILSTRPSLKIKNFAYFCSWLPLFFSSFIGFFGIKLLEIILAIIIGSKFFQWQPVYLFIKSFSYATQIFFILFFLDSDHTISQFFYSLIRSVKMSMYNYPICLFFGLIILGLEIMGSFLTGIFLFVWEETGLFLRIVDLINKIIFIPLQLAIFSNIYIKKLHEQFDYYFSTKGRV